MHSTHTCPQCGIALPAGTPWWLCPHCLLEQAARPANAEGGGTAFEAPTPQATSSGLMAGDHPRRLGGYELIELIGRGGMGIVYKARQISLDRLVAVKLLSLSTQHRDEILRRFRTEAVTAGSLQHPNIVAVHEVGFAEGQHFLVMDYVAGVTLAELVRHRPLASRRAAQYVRTIAAAVHFAHEHGILHRDLKPSNVLIDENDQPRVTDFGLAKYLTDSQRSTLGSQLTFSGEVLGSPAFISPEQASGRRERIGRPSDVYALGAILYQLLTGRPPFVGEVLADLLRQVLDEDPPRPRLLNPAVPGDLETVCLKCLEKEPGRRYPTAQALAEELGRFLEDLPIVARRPGGAGRLGRWCRRKPLVAVLIGGLVLAIGGGLLGILRELRRANAAELLEQHHVYAADMREVQRALEECNLARARELLNRHRPAGPSTVDLRGWEWRYLWAHCQSEALLTLHPYTNAVSALAFSPDGQWLAVVREENILALWDVSKRQPMADLTSPQPPPRASPVAKGNRALAFSPRGEVLAWGVEDGQGAGVVRLRDLSTQRELAALPHPTKVVSLAFSHDGQRLATMALDGEVRVWDLDTQRALIHFATRRPAHFAEPLAAAEDGHPSAAVPDADGQPALEAATHRTGATRHLLYADLYGCVRFSPEDRWLAVGEAVARLWLLDCATGQKRELALPSSAYGISALAFSADQRWLAAACGETDNNIYLWDLTAATNVAAVQLEGHRGWILDLAFSPHEPRLASVSTDQTLRLWEVTGKGKSRRFQGHTNEVRTVAWSPDGRNLVTGDANGSLVYWDSRAPPRPAYEKMGPGIWVFGLEFLPDSRSFLTVSRDQGEVVRWNAATLQPVECLSYLGTNHTCLALWGERRWLALGDWQGTTQVWDLETKRLIARLGSPEGLVLGVFFSARGKLLGRGSPNPNATVWRIWEVDGWREIRVADLPLSPIAEAHLAPDERTLANGSSETTAVWYDVQTLKPRAVFDCRPASAMRVHFSPDGRWFAAGGYTDPISLWEVSAPRSRRIIRGHRPSLTAMVFSADSRRLLGAGGCAAEVIKIWDVATGREVASLPGDPGWFGMVGHLGFSPDDRTLFANSLEGRTLLWRAPSWEEIEAAESQSKPPNVP